MCKPMQTLNFASDVLPWHNFFPKSSNKSKAHGFFCRCLLVLHSGPSADELRHWAGEGISQSAETGVASKLLRAYVPSFIQETAPA